MTRVLPFLSSSLIRTYYAGADKKAGVAQEIKQSIAEVHQVKSAVDKLQEMLLQLTLGGNAAQGQLPLQACPASAEGKEQGVGEESRSTATSGQM